MLVRQAVVFGVEYGGIMKKNVKINQADLQFIYGDDYSFFKSKIISNCFCTTCPNSKYDSTIVDYAIFVNELNDLILKGKCAKCGNKIARYLETGEVEEYAERIMSVLITAVGK